jgi:hypothetical protein
MSTYFERDVETVLDFHNQHAGKSSDQQTAEIRRILLSNLNNIRVGTYSKFHENSTYHLGYDHSTTIRLAYMYKCSFLLPLFYLLLTN